MSCSKSLLFFPLRKIPIFYLNSWCGNFLGRNSFNSLTYAVNSSTLRRSQSWNVSLGLCYFLMIVRINGAWRFFVKIYFYLKINQFKILLHRIWLLSAAFDLLIIFKSDVNKIKNMLKNLTSEVTWHKDWRR